MILVGPLWTGSIKWPPKPGNACQLKSAYEMKNWGIKKYNVGVFERPLKVKKNGVFIFVISHIVPEIFTIFVLWKLGTDDVIRCDSMEVKTQSREYLCK